jgi:hypothetical protein
MPAVSNANSGASRLNAAAVIASGATNGGLRPIRLLDWRKRQAIRHGCMRWRAGGHQAAGERGQRGAGTFNGSQIAAGDAESGSAAARGAGPQGPAAGGRASRSGAPQAGPTRTGVGAISDNHPTGHLEHPWARRLGQNPCLEETGAGTRTLALGVHRNVFSAGPLGGKRPVGVP